MLIAKDGELGPSGGCRIGFGRLVNSTCLAAFVLPKLPGSVSLKSASARSSEVRLLTYVRKKLLGGKAA